MSRTRRGYADWFESFSEKPKRDHKPWYKPDSAFKKLRGRLRRARVKAAMRRGLWDLIPKFKKGDMWDWT